MTWGVMGALDVQILGDLFGGEKMGSLLAKQWDGGVYYAGQRRSATPAEKKTAGSIGLAYLSRWKSPAAAETFLQMYAAQLGRKYDGLTERNKDEAAGEQVFTTKEGDVELMLQGSSVFVAEGYPVATARKLGAEFLAVQGTGPMKMASAPGHELTLGLARGLAGFGMMKVGMGRYTCGLGMEAKR